MTQLLEPCHCCQALFSNQGENMPSSHKALPTGPSRTGVLCCRELPTRPSPFRRLSQHCPPPLVPPDPPRPCPHHAFLPVLLLAVPIPETLPQFLPFLPRFPLAPTPFGHSTSHISQARPGRPRPRLRFSMSFLLLVATLDSHRLLVLIAQPAQSYHQLSGPPPSSDLPPSQKAQLPHSWPASFRLH